jgi:prepilin-type processing-associated H-X9-DG protein
MEIIALRRTLPDKPTVDIKLVIIIRADIQPRHKKLDAFAGTSIEIGGCRVLGVSDPILRGSAHIGWFDGHSGIAPHL